MISIHLRDDGNRYQPYIYLALQEHGGDPGRIIYDQFDVLYNVCPLDPIEQRLGVQITDCSYSYFSVQFLYINFGPKSTAQEINSAKNTLHGIKLSDSYLPA